MTSEESLATYVSGRLDSIDRMRIIIKDMDPASGVTFAVKRGAMTDTSLSMPWVYTELGDLETAKSMLGELISAQRQSLRGIWKKNIIDQMKALESVYERLNKELV